jgi:hypothetical protein
MKQHNIICNSTHEIISKKFTYKFKDIDNNEWSAYIANKREKVSSRFHPSIIKTLIKRKTKVSRKRTQTI